MTSANSRRRISSRRSRCRNLRATRSIRLAILGKQAALPKLAEWMHTDDVDMRANVRREFARAAQEASAQMLAAMIDDPKQTPLVRLEMLRAIGPRLSDIQSNATRALDALLAHADMSTRYLALEPLAALAKSGERTSGARCSNARARSRLARARTRRGIARDLPAVQSELVSAIDDAEPRVRQSALDTIAALRVSPAAVLVEKRLESDPWTFVRVAAAHALSSMGAARNLDKALATALDDKSPQVRSAVLDALAEHRARDYASAVRARLDDEQELGDVRVSAVHASARCAIRPSSNGSRSSRAPPRSDGERRGPHARSRGDYRARRHASRRSATRLHKLRDKSVRDAVRAAAEHALSTPSRCSR